MQILFLIPIALFIIAAVPATICSTWTGLDGQSNFTCNFKIPENASISVKRADRNDPEALILEIFQGRQIVRHFDGCRIIDSWSFPDYSGMTIMCAGGSSSPKVEVHLVELGDSYASIAADLFDRPRMFAEIGRFNGWASLHPGMKIRIPTLVQDPYVSHEDLAR